MCGCLFFLLYCAYEGAKQLNLGIVKARNIQGGGSLVQTEQIIGGTAIKRSQRNQVLQTGGTFTALVVG